GSHLGRVGLEEADESSKPTARIGRPHAEPVDDRDARRGISLVLLDRSTDAFERTVDEIAGLAIRARSRASYDDVEERALCRSGDFPILRLDEVPESPQHATAAHRRERAEAIDRPKRAHASLGGPALRHADQVSGDIEARHVAPPIRLERDELILRERCDGVETLAKRRSRRETLLEDVVDERPRERVVVDLAFAVVESRPVERDEIGDRKRALVDEEVALGDLREDGIEERVVDPRLRDGRAFESAREPLVEPTARCDAV